jgi:thiamine pyrophosphokinase
MHLVTTALIICNGAPPPPAFVRRCARGADLVIAADGGADTARQCSVRPDVIIGDFDSVNPSTLRRFSTSTILHMPQQDNTDLEKALEYAVARGIHRAVIVGADGNRIDFTLSNLMVFWKYGKRIALECAGPGWRALPVGRSATMKARCGTIVSLIPFGTCQGIALRGLQYPLTNATMRNGDTGISNVVRRSPFRVSVRRGNMLLVMLDPPRRRR